MHSVSLAATAAAFLTSAATAERHTYANPIDVDYRYNFEQINEGVSYRTGADPAVVSDKGAYILRFGIRADRLTLTYQLWADELGNGAMLTKDLRSLNVGVRYWVAVEAFNETGVSKLSRVVPVR